MHLSRLKSHMGTKQMLEKMLTKASIPSTLLFHGSEEKLEFAKAFAKDLMQVPERVSDSVDLVQIKPEGKVHLHNMQTLKDFINTFSLYPLEAKKKVAIIYEAERMLPSHANALLKLLEEPAKHGVIILISDRAEKVIDTIRSRCVHCPFFETKEKQINEEVKGCVEETLAGLFNQSYDAFFKHLDQMDQMITKSEDPIHLQREILGAFTKLFAEAEKCKAAKTVSEGFSVELIEHIAKLSVFEKWQNLLATIEDALDKHLKLSRCLEGMLFCL